MEHLLNRGLPVRALDHQSQGGSEGIRPGVRCFWESFSDLSQDVIDMTNALKKAGASHVVLVASSMGGAVALRAMMMASPGTFLACALVSPLISLERAQNTKVACCITNRHLGETAEWLGSGGSGPGPQP